VDFRVLGPLEVVDDDSRPLALGGHKQRAVLARLLLRPNSVVSAAALMEAAWGEELPERARDILQVYVANLRKLLDAGAGQAVAGRIARRGSGYEIRVGEDELDLNRFSRLVTYGRVALGRGDALRAAELLRDALGLWRGPAFPDLTCTELVHPEVSMLEELRLSVLEDRIDAELGAGRAGDLVAELDSLVRAHPLRERLHGQLILALYREGRQAEALEAYQRVRETLLEELGIEPAPSLQDLQRAVLRQDPGLDPHARATVSRLPRAVDDFVGRQAELTDVTGALERHPLVTVTGPGGVGKTRLALEVAGGVAAGFRDGAWFVDLSTTEDPAQVPTVVAEALQVSVRSGEDIAERVVETLREASSLVVLDNCEHVLTGVRALVGRALTQGPDLRLLATSREPLHVRGEAAIPLRPLGLPDGDGSVSGSDAVDLFCTRARAADPAFHPDAAGRAVAAQICRRLDGLPLAIELAAVRVRAMSLRELAQRLDDRFGLLVGTAPDLPARQRTLAAVVRWSYDLLAGAERALFVRLSVFPGSFPLEAVEAVAADAQVPADDVPRLLVQLVEKSLVGTVHVPGAGLRYELLETLRRFGQDRLAEDRAAERWQDRLLAWALVRVEELEQHMRTPRQDALLAAARIEQHNMRGALEWALQRGQRLPALRIASTVPLGLPVDRRALLERLLAEVPDAPAGVRARAHLALSNLLFELGDYPPAVESASAAVRAAAGAGDRRTEAWGRLFLLAHTWPPGEVETVREAETAAASYARLLDDFRALDEPLGLAYVTWTLALRAPGSPHAEAWASEAVDRFRALEAPFGLAHALEGHCLVALRGGDLPRARRLIDEAVHHLAASGNLGCTAHALEAAAACLARGGQGLEAAELAGAAEEFRARSGHARRPWEDRAHEEMVASLRASDDGFREAVARGRLHSLRSAGDAAHRLLTRPEG